MRYYIIAGEASGDLHGGNLISRLHREDPGAAVRCWGGEMMEAAGATLVRHYRDLAFMGFAEVLTHLPTILGNLAFCKKDIEAWAPDVVVLIDYPGFNLRIAEWAHARGYRVVYYISPQIWAWKESRVKVISRSVDKLLVILPFEKEFYRRWNYEAEYVGHPLVEVVKSRKAAPRDPPVLTDKPLIALLPGSRSQEVAKKLPVMLKMTRHFPAYGFAVARAPHLDAAMLGEMLQDYPDVQVVKGRTYELLRQATAALVTSGTATLETALFGVPQVVCYKGNAVSYQLARWLVKVKYISLVNLIMDKPVVTELIQNDLNEENLRRELAAILEEDRRMKMMADYRLLWDKLDEGDASARAAKTIVAFLTQTRTGSAGSKG
jgi:lipid-A-disaccharide synthase